MGALIEQAEDRKVSGDHDGALEFLDRAVAIPGPDAAYAMAARTESLFQLGRPVEAHSQLEGLRKHSPFSAVAFHRAAEAAETSGDERLALHWFEMALSRCTDQLQQGELDESDAPQVSMLIRGRRRVRASLGLPADEVDRALAPNPPTPKVAYPGELPPGVATSESLVQVLFWPRSQIKAAATRWPNLVQDNDIERVVQQRELENRRIVTEGGARIVMVPITVESLIEFASRTGDDPLDAFTRTKALNERYEQGEGIPWPPGRNNRCWCGSELKYKKCCGAIGLSGA